jgi:hypothetical protein
MERKKQPNEMFKVLKDSRVGDGDGMMDKGWAVESVAKLDNIVRVGSVGIPDYWREE